MKAKTQKAILMEKIIVLEQQQAQDFEVLKNQYHSTISSFSTLNILKNAFQEVITTPHITSNIIQGALQIGTKYLSKSLLKNSSNSSGLLQKAVRFIIKKWSNR
jgi:hypothetical protein